MDHEKVVRKQARILLERLERLSADSIWAHRASGLRGSVIRALDQKVFRPDDEMKIHLEELIKLGYMILTKAASEIPDYDSTSHRN